MVLGKRTHITWYWQVHNSEHTTPSTDTKCQHPVCTSSAALVLSGSLLGDPIPGVEEVLLSRSLKPCASNKVEMELEWNRASHSPSWPGRDEADDAAVHFGKKNGNYTTVPVQSINKYVN